MSELDPLRRHKWTDRVRTRLPVGGPPTPESMVLRLAVKPETNALQQATVNINIFTEVVTYVDVGICFAKCSLKPCHT